ncbi:organoarsenical effux MFS transporter ArsJ [Phragmitibacter flavus]|uniref:Organoarsenical effux MFS transporter ArsJ n=1 Tax=Phragmitibacter flavus TaxID=2576071 RepID=A0A5R8KBL3_9BACT|nr:organoarsenical effux MFS transporter ArsJ [Phragmitibacter flavus]TLD69691.1 organoarsenical effux MFS transporter ArsJ [Phragmitibacter flavus]
MKAGDLKNGQRNYAVVTLAYWADTLADGAIRMLVLFYFYQLGYSALQVASLFLFYEIFGVITNLCGGYLGARFGLKSTLFLGLGTQLVALGMLGFMPAAGLTVVYVMASQALSGIAKDLTKMSSKSAVKLVAGSSEGRLYKWVAVLTGSKNALKGVGFFLGAWMLSFFGVQTAVWTLVGVVSVAMVAAGVLVKGGLGVADKKARFRQLFSSRREVNVLAAARLFLFGARDVWFVVAVPVFLSSVLGWPFWKSGGFMAAWVIGYGMVQAAAPMLVGRGRVQPHGGTAVGLAFLLAVFPAGIALALWGGVVPGVAVVSGLILFGVVFALNSAVHSYLILAYADGDKVAMNVGFYYMANACGRLAGTVLSGWVYQMGVVRGESMGLVWCLAVSTGLVLAAGGLALGLPGVERKRMKEVHLS